MGYNREDSCKKCRRLNTKLFLKGEKCYTEKCGLEKKKKSAEISRRRRLSRYGQQLREKQKTRWIYRISENQFRRYYQMAKRSSNITGEELLRLLERRLDNVIYRLGFSLSRAQARQLISHCHFLVNGKKVNISSYLVKEKDIIEVKKKSKKLLLIKQILQASEKKVLPEWLELNKESLKGVVKRLPRDEELNQEIAVPLIVEYYSR